MKKLAVSNSVGVFAEGEKALNYEANYPFINESALANIKTLEALYYVNTEDTDLIALLIKGYAGYTYGVLETNAFEDILLEKNDSEKIAQVKAGYSKAIDFGIKYFELNGISQKDLLSNQAMKAIDKEITDPSAEDLKAMFFFAQSLAGLFNLERQNMFLLGTTPLITGLMDKVCKLKPDFENGACDLFQAVFEATKPAIMGGDIARANKLFEKTFKKDPKNLLNKVTYIQYSLLPLMEDEKYKQMKPTLKKELVRFNRVNDFGKLIQDKTTFPKKLNLYNAIASERFKHIEKIEKELF